MFDFLPMHFTGEPYVRIGAVGDCVDCYDVLYLLSFTTSNVLINNGAFSDFRGKVNGLGQVLAAVGRFIGPTMGSTIFAWSISEDRPFPLNYGFTYYISLS